MYAVNSLSIYYDVPCVPGFQVINHLTRYLYICPRHPIVCPSDLEVAITHELCQEVSLCDFHSKNISNGHVTFVDDRGGLPSNNKRAISCVILCLFWRFRPLVSHKSNQHMLPI